MLDVQTVDMQIDRTHYLERLFAWLTGAFGLLATLLASIGLYGVTAFAVARRTREIGIRTALGADRENVLGMVMREVLVLAAFGIAIGLPLAIFFGRYVESQLYAVKGTDPLIEAAATFAIVVVSVVAGYLPARRAAKIDPLAALRYE
jgi:ABC-type antimicrobial peptide transport system permease subunit